jgi:serine/threonine protein kinase
MSVKQQSGGTAASGQTGNKLSANDLVFLKVLGQGSFGKVMLAQRKQGDASLMAVKVLKKEVVIETEDVDCIMTEKRVLSVAHEHPFLTNMIASFQTAARLYFVMEFVTGGDLMNLIQKQGVFREPAAVFYSGEIFLGFWFMHERGIIYRDLKLDNIMLAGDGHIKIADFGLCKENVIGDAKTKTFCGTPDYIAPEIIEMVPYGASVDYWTMGVFIYELMLGQPPYSGESEEDLFESITTSTPRYPKALSRTAASIMQGLMAKVPNMRLGCKSAGKNEIKEHPFYKDVDWDKLEAKGVTPPYVPQKATNVEDAAKNFDETFTGAKPELTPTDKKLVETIDQSEFKDFSFCA